MYSIGKERRFAKRLKKSLTCIEKCVEIIFFQMKQIININHVELVHCGTFGRSLSIGWKRLVLERRKRRRSIRSSSMHRTFRTGSDISSIFSIPSPTRETRRDRQVGDTGTQLTSTIPEVSSGLVYSWGALVKRSHHLSRDRASYRLLYTVRSSSVRDVIPGYCKTYIYICIHLHISPPYSR